MSKPRPLTPRAASSKRGELDRRLDAELFKALADPTRLTLLACLAKCGRACSVGEIADSCAVDLSVVSRHLSQLQRARVLDVRREGRAVLYGVRHAELASTLRALADAIEGCCPSPEDCTGGAAMSCCSPRATARQFTERKNS